MITADTLLAWSRLLATCAGHFEALANEARPRSPAYLRFVEQALRCENAVDYESDDVLLEPCVAEKAQPEAVAANPNSFTEADYAAIWPRASPRRFTSTRIGP